VKTVSVVVPTHQRPDTLRKTLEALLSVDYPSDAFRVIVVDDANSSETADVVAALSATDRVQLLSQDRLGAATARNVGARAADGDIVLFCDDDFLVGRSHLRLHVETHETLGRVLVGSNWWYSADSLAAFEATPFGRYRVALERGFQSGRSEHRISGNFYETGTLGAADMSISRDGFWELGGFDENFPYAGVEDQDFCIRARDAGYTLIRNYDLTPQHNDPTVTLRQFALREERGAATVVVFEQKYPEARVNFGINAPVSRHDGPRLIARKLAKSTLSTEPALEALHRTAAGLERAGASDRVLHRLYRTILGLHLFRGYRTALEEQGRVAA
jgi:GT2 family glycosyltransferase